MNSVPVGKLGVGARTAKRESRVVACGRSSSQATRRSTLIATPFQICHPLCCKILAEFIQEPRLAHPRFPYHTHHLPSAGLDLGQ
jgi:hypothetical protein